MSEPLSSSEIEDVVSSVRRLVSPESRPRVVSRDLGLDRLILTPSLRIVADQQGNGPAVVTLEAVAKRSRSSSRRTKTRMMAPPILTDEGAEVLPPVVDAAESVDAGSGSAPSLSEMALGAEEAELVIAEPVADAPEPKPLKTRRKAAEPAVTAVKAAPARKARSRKPAAVEEQPKAVARKSRTAPKAKAPEVDLAPAAAVPQEAPVPVAEAVALELEPVVETAALEAVETLAADAIEMAEAAEQPATPAPALMDEDGNPISLLDEDQLIQLLRRVIREELQGGLGEKITRNVRKLVRAEINRALTTQTLE